MAFLRLILIELVKLAIEVDSMSGGISWIIDTYIFSQSSNTILVIVKFICGWRSPFLGQQLTQKCAEIICVMLCYSAAVHCTSVQ